MTFAPNGGYGDYRGQSVFTHGLQVGLEGSNARNLRSATNQLIQSLAQSNPQLRQSGSFSNVTIGGRNGLATVLTNVSDATGQPERIALYTTLMNDGSVFFVAGVSAGGRVLNLSTDLQSLGAVAATERWISKLGVLVSSFELDDARKSSSSRTPRSISRCTCSLFRNSARSARRLLVYAWSIAYASTVAITPPSSVFVSMNRRRKFLQDGREASGRPSAPRRARGA